MIEEVFTCNLCGEDFDGENIQNHPEVCEYKCVECDNECGIKLYRRDIEEHKLLVCIKRFLECEHCQEKYIAISMKDHYKCCAKMVIECPENCDIKDLQREQLKLHLETVCSVNTLPCDFEYAQCQFRGTRDSLVKHLKESCELHIQLLGTMVVGLSQQLLQTQQQLLHSQLTIENLRADTQNQLKILKNESNEQLELIKTEVSKNLYNAYLWKITDVKEHCEYSTTFYLSKCGYKMKMRVVYFNVNKENMCVSLLINLVPGEYDCILSWPFRLKFTISLLDQSTDKPNPEHINWTITPNIEDLNENWKRPDKNKNPIYLPHRIILLKDGKFIKDDTILILFKII